MTIIIGLKDVYGNLYLAGDSCSIEYQNESIESTSNKKIFLNNGFLLGVSGNIRIMDILHYIFDPPLYKPFDNISLNDFMVRDFVPNLIKCLKKNKCISEKEGVVTMDSSIVVGIAGELFCIESDFQVGVCGKNGFIVTGAASEPAKGSLYSSYFWELDPLEAIELALLASEEFSRSIKRPFYIINNYNYKTSEINKN